MQSSEQAGQRPLPPRGGLSEWMLYLLVLVAGGTVFHQVLRHPTQVLYSDYSDILAQHYPFRFLLADAVRGYGRLPLWNPYDFCGKPLVGDPQAGLFYPPNWLHCLVPPARTACLFGWLVLMHVVLGGWGMLWWLRGHRLSGPARLLAAFSFMLSAKWLLHIVVPGHIGMLPVVWLPWLCGLTDRLWQRRSWRDCGLWALVAATACLGSHPQLLFYAAILVGGYTIVSGLKLCTGPWPAAATRVLLAYLLAGGLWAIQLLPAVELTAACVRAGGLSYAAAARKSLGPAELVRFLFPHYISPTGWERQAYCGVLPLALLPFALGQRRNRWLAGFMIGSFLFAVLHALGPAGGLHPLLFRWVPGFNLFRVPIRILLVAGLPLGALAAIGGDELAKAAMGRGWRLLAAALLGAGIGFALIDRSVLGAWSCLPLAAPFAVLALRRAGLNPVGLTAALAALGFLQAATYAIPLVQTRTLADAIGANPIVPFIRQHAGPFRVYAPGESYPTDTALPPCDSVPARIERLRGFNPLVPKVTYRYLRQGIGGEPPSHSYKEFIRNFKLQRRPYLDLLGVRFIVAAQHFDLPDLVKRRTYRNLRIYHYSTREPGGRSPMSPIHVYENLTAWPRAALVPGAVPAADAQAAFESIATLDLHKTIPVEGISRGRQGGGSFTPLAVQQSPNERRVHCQAPHGGFLLLTEMWYPGWRAWEGNQEMSVLRAGGTFCAVELAPGEHTIRFRYLPASYTAGRAITLLSLAVVVGLMCLGRRRKHVLT